MRKSLLVSLLALGMAVSGQAQGYKDGIEYYKVGRLDNAKELLERNLNAAGTNKAEAYYYLGQIALHDGDVDTAVQYFDKGVAADPACALNYVGQGAVALKKGINPKSFFEQARKSAKKNCYVEMEIARAMYAADAKAHAKDITKAINQTRKWKAEDPNSFIFDGDMRADQKEWGDAAAQYEWAFTYDPNNIEAYVKYANTYFNVNPDFAIKRLEELNAKQPGSALVQRELAEKYYADNQGSKAAEMYGQYIKNPNHFAQDEVRYVQLLYFGGKYQESYDLATSLISKLQPGDSKIFFMRRMQILDMNKLENWAGAVEAGDKFFELDVPQGAAYTANDYTSYAEALTKVGRPKDALEAYEAAAELNRDDLDMMRMLSDAYTEVEDYEKAASIYERVVNHPNRKANDLYEMAVKYLNIAVTTDEDKREAIAENAGKALKYLNEVNELVPGNVRIVNQIARATKIQEGENKGNAVQAYKNLIALLDQKEDRASYATYYISAYNYLAADANNRGDKAAAKEYYIKWLEADPNNDDLRNYVNTLK